jgi:Ca2+-binding RTX toxin-like protein
LLIALSLCFVFLVVPASALAVPHVSIGQSHTGSGQAMVVRDASSRSNDLGVGREAFNGVVFDFASDDSGVTATAPCVVLNQFSAGCPVDNTRPGIDVFSGRGNDRILLGQGPGPIMFVRSGAGNDEVIGSSNNDVILGEAGNDSLKGDQGNDTLLGGAGRDRLVGSAGIDALIGGSGNDLLFGGPGREQLRGGKGSDRCVGGPGPENVIACESR